MKVALTCNSKSEMEKELRRRGLTVTDDSLEEYDSAETIQAILDALSNNGHLVREFGWGTQLVANLNAYTPDLVFNIAEGYGGRSREAQVPALLEMLGIPFVGSDALALAVSLDKQATKDMVSSARVPVAKGLLVRSQGDLALLRYMPCDVHFPVVVKPNQEGSSRGVTEAALVKDPNALLERVCTIAQEYKQPALIEEFVEGTEVTVGIVGDPPRVLGIMEIAPADPDKPFPLYSLEVKRDFRTRVRYTCPAPFEASVLTQISDYALDAFKVMGCRDMARVDFRLGSNGPVFLEINPLPGLNPETSDLCIMAKALDIPYAQLLSIVMSGAMARNHLGTEVWSSKRLDLDPYHYAEWEKDRKVRETDASSPVVPT